MADYIVKDTQLEAIADGARNVLESTDKMTVAEIAEKLKAYIPGGSLKPENFQQDNTEGIDLDLTDITKPLVEYAFAYTTINSIKFPTSNEWAKGQISRPNPYNTDYYLYEGYQFNSIKYLGAELAIPNLVHGTGGDDTGADDYNCYMFHQANLSKVTKLDLQKLQDNAYSMFFGANLSGLTELSLPALTSGINMFYQANLSSLTDLSLPALTAATYMFYQANLSSMTDTQLNKAIKEMGSLDNYMFQNIYVGEGNIKKLKLDVKSIGNGVFGVFKVGDITSSTEYQTDIKVFIPSTCETIDASGYYSAPFFNWGRTKTNIEFYTDASEKPSGWGDYFNYLTNSVQGTVHYGVTEAQFDAL